MSRILGLGTPRIPTPDIPEGEEEKREDWVMYVSADSLLDAVRRCVSLRDDGILKLSVQELDMYYQLVVEVENDLIRSILSNMNQLTVYRSELICKKTTDFSEVRLLVREIEKTVEVYRKMSVNVDRVLSKLTELVKEDKR